MRDRVRFLIAVSKRYGIGAGWQLIRIWLAMLVLCGTVRAQTWQQAGNATLERAPTSTGYIYRFNMGAKGFFYVPSTHLLDSLVNRGGGNNYIANQTDTVQNAAFNVSGNGYFSIDMFNYLQINETAIRSLINRISIYNQFFTSTGSTITGLPNRYTARLRVDSVAVSPTDVVPLQQLQMYLPLAGGTLTGALNGVSLVNTGIVASLSNRGRMDGRNTSRSFQDVSPTSADAAFVSYTTNQGGAGVPTTVHMGLDIDGYIKVVKQDTSAGRVRPANVLLGSMMGTTMKYDTVAHTLDVVKLKVSTVLDFPSTSAQSSTTLTMTVTGAVDGDVVTLGETTSVQNSGLVYSAYVSSAGVVTVVCNNYSTAAINPNAGTFTVIIFR